jgi:hypothetical protein
MDDLTQWRERSTACSLRVAILSNSGHFRLSEDKSGRRSAAKLLRKNAARRIAANFAKLPRLLGEVDTLG